jgi:4-oxalomesaconate tautomerase
MPSVLVAARALGNTGYEDPRELEEDSALARRIAEIRVEAAQRMHLGSDLATSTVPKIVLVAEPMAGGTIATRSFIPTRVHTSVGVLGAASIAAAVMTPGTVAHAVARQPDQRVIRIEHPSGFLDLDVDHSGDSIRTSVIRSARLLFDGTTYPRPSLR